MDLSPAAPHVHVQDYCPKHDWWRIKNVPTSWSIKKLLQMLQKQDESLAKMEEESISLYPSCSIGVHSSQTGLMSMNPLPQYFQELDPHETHLLILEEISEADGRREKFFLGLDCHFQDLTPLNVPIGGNIVE